MSLVFSCEEKRRILLHVVDKALEGSSTMTSDDEKWKELGREMNRDWQEIRDAYYQWRVEDNKPDVKKIENDEHVHDELAIGAICDDESGVRIFVLYCQIFVEYSSRFCQNRNYKLLRIASLTFTIVYFIQVIFHVLQALAELRTVEQDEYPDEIQYATLDGYVKNVFLPRVQML